MTCPVCNGSGLIGSANQPVDCFECEGERPVTDLDKYDLGLTDEEGDAFMAAIREARRGPDPLATLRAEVERLRDEASAKASNRAARSYTTMAAAWDARCSALSEVLGLIDKQREGHHAND